MENSNHSRRKEKVLESSRHITDGEIADALKRPSDFAYFGDNDEMFETWSLGPVIRTRDSGILEESNAAALERHLESDKSLEGDWTITGASHWGPGWVDHVSFKVIEDGEPTRVFKIIMEWFDALSDYPVADDADYSEREYKATLANIKSQGYGKVIEAADEDWPSQCLDWFWDYNQSAVENNDDQGGYPSDEDMDDCLKFLNLYKE